MRTIFWNVDTQYDFMRSDGKLYVQGAEQIERNLEILTQLAETQGIKVVNTADWHKQDSPELSDNPDFVNTFPPHCLQNTKGAEYVPATSPKNPYAVEWEEGTLDLEKIVRIRNIKGSWRRKRLWKS